MVMVKPKSKITRLLNRVNSYGLWFDWFAGPPRAKVVAFILISLWVIAIVVFDLTVLIMRFVRDELAIPIISDYLQSLLK